MKTENIFLTYWRAYGGFRALYKSIFFRISVIITILSYEFWLKPEWIDSAISILPNLLGFTLGGYSVWLGLGDEKLKKILSNKDEVNPQPSVYMIVNASFVHFIFLQSLCLSCVLFLKTNSLGHLITKFTPPSFKDLVIVYIDNFYCAANAIVFFLFIYSILSMIAATFALFSIAKALDKLNRVEDSKL